MYTMELNLVQVRFELSTWLSPKMVKLLSHRYASITLKPTKLQPPAETTLTMAACFATSSKRVEVEVEAMLM